MKFKDSEKNSGSPDFRQKHFCRRNPLTMTLPTQYYIHRGDKCWKRAKRTWKNPQIMQIKNSQNHANQISAKFCKLISAILLPNYLMTQKQLKHVKKPDFEIFSLFTKISFQKKLDVNNKFLIKPWLLNLNLCTKIIHIMKCKCLNSCIVYNYSTMINAIKQQLHF